MANALKDYKISGWIATTSRPKDVEDQHRVVSIFAHGKLIQENILADFQDARYYRQYIIGEIDADFMDDDEEADIVTSDRQRINQNDPRYTLLKNFIAGQVRRIGNDWDNLRAKLKVKRGKDTELRQTPAQPPSGQPNLFGLPSFLRETDSEDSKPALYPLDEGVSGDASVDPQEQQIDNQIVISTTNGPNTTGQVSPSTSPRPSPLYSIGKIRAAIQASTLEEDFKDIILYDLEQARLAYNSAAYKACIIMLGAALEGLMLGTLRRPEVIDRILGDTSPPKEINDIGGTQNPIFADRMVFAMRMSERLGFDAYRKLIERYIPQVQSLNVENIQRFRNTVHPWSSIQHPDVFGTNTAARAMIYFSSLEVLTGVILSWNP